MNKILLRGAWTEKKCTRCTAHYDVDIDGVLLCEECLVRAVHETSPNKQAGRDYEVRLLEGELARLTGRQYRGLKSLSREAIEDLRRAVRDIEYNKAQANSKLRRYGLPGI